MPFELVTAGRSSGYAARSQAARRYLTMLPTMPRSLRYLRALLLVMAVLLALNTVGRLGIVLTYGASDGTSLVVGAGLLAIVGCTVLLVILLLKRPIRAYFGGTRPRPAAKAA